MQRRLAVSSMVAGMAAMALLYSAGAQATMYRYTDANGQLVISSTIPQEATRRGYQILNNSGRVIDTIPAAPTAEEIAAREAKKERQRQRERQQEEDRQLLKRFSHPDQAVRAMHRKMRELEGIIQLKRGNISVISSQLDEEQSRAANMERAGRAIPDTMLEKIQRLEAQIRDIEREISAQRQSIGEMKKTFVNEVERLEIITGESRTLPLDPDDG
ncbi:DUF4124 domain-containing protein [Marinobacter fuscus]|uniref:DUF4124 domain-containing protein n=1 Tax=Marinobacter fuscus TaxID=2109942 RepID=A0A2T1KQF6_9GAMM|nr:DUF4124 domain-containing protein [Marinobacter fuscus]PSF12335.1 DUF4124 domain-containing protein [Marinobacter fuscus]